MLGVCLETLTHTREQQAQRTAGRQIAPVPQRSTRQGAISGKAALSQQLSVIFLSEQGPCHLEESTRGAGGRL